MASNKKKKTEPKPEPVVEVQEMAEMEVPTPEVIVEETPVAVAKAPTKVVHVKIYRDGEGRLVLEQEGQSKRIAGSDDAFIEVARQFGEKLVRERQI